MHISEEMKKELRYAKDFTVTTNYLILYTGRKAVICDRSLRILKIIPNLKYVYNGYVSLDEKYLLLVASGRYLRLVSLEDFSVVCNYTTPRPFCGNLEGRACPSLTQQDFYVPLQNEATGTSKLRVFHCEPSFGFRDLPLDGFWIVRLFALENENCYLAIALNRLDHQWNLIWFGDDEVFRICPVIGFDDAVLHEEVLENTKQILLMGDTNHLCDFNGLPSPKVKASTLFPNELLTCIPEKYGEIYCVSPSSQDPCVFYVGTATALVVWDSSKRAVMKHRKVEFGVHNITQLSSNLILLSTWGGVKVEEV